MFAINEKSLAEITPVLATRTARPVMPPKVKLLVNLKKYVPTAIISVLTVSSPKFFAFDFMIYIPQHTFSAGILQYVGAIFI